MSFDTARSSSAASGIESADDLREHEDCTSGFSEAAICQEDLFAFGPESLTRPPEAITAFVERAIRCSKYYNGPNNRSEVRYAVRLRVTAVPVDENLQKCGEPFVAVSRDISGRGIAIYHTRGVSEKFLALELSTASGEKMHVVLEMLRCRPVGLFYEIAGRFVTKLGE